MNNKLISKDELLSFVPVWAKQFIDENALSGSCCSGVDSFYYTVSHDSNGISRCVGAQLWDDHWEIYNCCEYRRYTNIKIFNEHAEFIENSTFADFSRDEMHSLYEFLNDKIFNTKKDENAKIDEIVSHIQNQEPKSCVSSDTKIEPLISTEDIKNIITYIIYKIIKDFPISTMTDDQIKSYSKEIIGKTCNDKTMNDLVIQLRNSHKRTEHRFLVCKKTNSTSNIWMYIKDVHISYKDTELNNDTTDCDDKICRIIKGYGGGCIWGKGLLVMDMDNENIISDIEQYTLTENLKIMLGKNAQLCDVTSTLAPDGELSTEHEFFK